ncbi:uncharacterized protein M421DRAFT_193163 [Didymella exigua CBS 183.55]|uniref:Uncharacterized protein n=1 Tax=Didymella exigua CBS 183.55 TaxID=1150837 RepID=A0A6A5S1D9_9PLEO|nr:uncharacterized protein M421DRAFT_193163 [Didymella exigua CBS 183.55]KAF1933264.1 hypothetical protein M421DRAFT_193163 [Didymella exigua CBS 183.55]
MREIQKQPSRLRSQWAVGTLAHAGGRGSLVLRHLVPCNLQPSYSSAACEASLGFINLGWHNWQVGRCQHRAGYSPLRDAQQNKNAKICAWSSDSGDAGEGQVIGARCQAARCASSSRGACAAVGNRQGRLFVALLGSQAEEQQDLPASGSEQSPSGQGCENAR